MFCALGVICRTTKHPKRATICIIGIPFNTDRTCQQCVTRSRRIDPSRTTIPQTVSCLRHLALGHLFRERYDVSHDYVANFVTHNLGDTLYAQSGTDNVSFQSDRLLVESLFHACESPWSAWQSPGTTFLTSRMVVRPCLCHATRLVKHTV